MKDRKPVMLTSSEQCLLAELSETLFNFRHYGGTEVPTDAELRSLGEKVVSLLIDYDNVRLDLLYDIFHRTGANER